MFEIDLKRNDYILNIHKKRDYSVHYRRFEVYRDLGKTHKPPTPHLSDNFCFVETDAPHPQPADNMMMNDAATLANMMHPYDASMLYEQPKPRFIFKMPRVVPDQKSKFESDELFRRLGRESEVSSIPRRYTSFEEFAKDDTVCTRRHTTGYVRLEYM